MIWPFDIVRPTQEYVGRELDERALSSIAIEQGNLVCAGYVDPEMKRRMLMATGVVTESDGERCSIEWFDKRTCLKNAWWDEKDLDVVNNLAVVLADCMAHPFGGNTEQGERFFGAGEQEVERISED